MYNQVCPLASSFYEKLLTILIHQAKNVVLNISEMEAKVREATNDDPWCVKLSCCQELRPKSSFRGASSTLMQEIAQGYVLIVISVKYSVLTSFKDFPFVRSPFYLQALVLIYSDKIVKISMKLCPVSIRVSWKKKLDNGGRFTRFVSTLSFLSISLTVSSTCNRLFNFWNI